MSGRILVVGNGLAAHRLTARLAALGHDGPVTVLGDEPHPAYQRTLLGSVLAGGLPPGALTLPPPPAGVRVRTGLRALAIDRERRTVRCADGTRLDYDTLVLATGARPTGDVHTLADCARPVRGKVAVVGGGVLGVETATALRRRGHRVVLAHPGPYPMHHQLDEVSGLLVASRLESWGIELRLGAYVPSDDTLGADTVLRCTGTAPETTLAEMAGLTVRRGVVVDDRLRTSDPSIRAIGACTDTPDLVGAADLSGALAQAETLATLLTGGDASYTPAPPVVRPRVPGLDVVCLGRRGWAESDEVVTFSDPARGRYARIEITEQKVVRAVLVGMPEGIAAVSQLYDGGRPVPADRLALLLGLRAGAGAGGAGADPATLADEAVLCHCNNVSKGAVVRAWQDGARDVGAVAAATRATTGCGGCADAVRAVCAALRVPQGVA
ncbi:FAD-dependent oxidoreductase [Streptomyces sp. NBC_01353]|uniref:FAD-dependent oxidoreductase n=1 Tax=Streptomyces sp. NBC_01353 TaxID=2903835 RepID=UPI002E32CB29|nr:FAD-dependent oxidoreductase [Streptomyces sp. NBC_01353]